jgi:hypothetical protein
MKTTEKIYDVATGEETIIERDLTQTELDLIAKLAAEDKVISEEDAKAATNKAALLIKLGITADEAKLLLS